MMKSNKTVGRVRMRSIIVQELIRAVVILMLLIWGSAYLHETGTLAIPASSLIAGSGGISAAVFAVLVVVRTRTGKEFMLKRVRYLLTLGLLVGVPVFVWLMLTGEVTRAIFLAVGTLIAYVLLFILRKRLGIQW